MSDMSIQQKLLAAGLFVLAAKAYCESRARKAGEKLKPSEKKGPGFSALTDEAIHGNHLDSVHPQDVMPRTQLDYKRPTTLTQASMVDTETTKQITGVPVPTLDMYSGLEFERHIAIQQVREQ